MPLNKSNSQNGFTLIELLVAISIVAIISAIGMVSYTSAQQAARDSKRKQDLAALTTAVELYKQSTKAYPSTSSGYVFQRLATLSNGYINKLPDGPRCDTNNLSGECYYYSYSNGKFFLYTRMENAANADLTGCNTDESSDTPAGNWGTTPLTASNFPNAYCISVTN